MFRRQFLTSSTALLASQFLASRLGAEIAPASKSKLRVGVIGHTGRGGYGHGLDTLWQQLPQTEIVSVADADPAGLLAAQKRLGGVPGFSEYAQMLKESRLDIAAVCPRHIDQHHAMILAAIHAGVRGIYVEKPLARTPAEADEIVGLCREKKVALAIAHRNRYHPALPLAAELLATGELGKPLEIRARGKEDQRGGGLDLWVLGSHVLNLGVFFTGRPTACSASVFHEGRPATKADIKIADEGIGSILGDEIHARFETESGIPLFFDSKKNAGQKAAGFGLQVICTGGVIDLRMDSEPMIHVLKGSPFSPSGGTRAWAALTSGGLGKPEPLSNIKALVSGHHHPALDLIASIETGKQPLCGPEDGRLLIEMTHAIFASQLRSGARVTLPFEQRQGAFVDL